jgi:hypothetical protein
MYFLMLLLIFPCLIFSIPSFFLAYKMMKKKFLGTIFNKNIAIVLVVTGMK